MAKTASEQVGVELKAMVSERKERAAQSAFDLDVEKCEERQIYFFDTPRLSLFKKGVVLRARKIKGGDDDSTVKFRPVSARKIPTQYVGLDGFKVEADGIGERLIRSASFSVEQAEGEIDQVVRGERAIEKLFSDEQEEFLAQLSPVQFRLDDLAILGPVEASRWKLQHEGLPYEITAENWLLPDGKDFLEVSIKVPGVQAGSSSAAFETFLAELSLKPEGGQHAKTRIALDFFVERITRIEAKGRGSTGKVVKVKARGRSPSSSSHAGR